LELRIGGTTHVLRHKILVNAAGGGALKIAHACGVGLGYSSLNFRGDYWDVADSLGQKIHTNVYRPPRYPQFPFLDPHLVVRVNGRRQVGPNATFVPGPYAYDGFGTNGSSSILERPIRPKLKLLENPDFLSLVGREWISSVSKRQMCRRVKEFIPGLEPSLLERRTLRGIRSPIIDNKGFVPEALLIPAEGSIHILNYNSPGASGAPAYSALIVTKMKELGLFDGLVGTHGSDSNLGWNFYGDEWDP